MRNDFMTEVRALPLNFGPLRGANFVERYNTVRLHSAIGYITPKDKLEGRAEAVLAERERKLQEARERRARMRRSSTEKALTRRREGTIIRMVGETEAVPQARDGERPARDSRPGRRAFLSACDHAQPGVMGACFTRALGPCLASANAQRSTMPQKTPASGAEPQDIVTGQTPGGPESLIGVRRLSNSR